MARDRKQDATVYPKNLNLAWAELIIRQLVASGCDTFIISPGMRNGPLISAINDNPQAKLEINIDERSAAYQALGFCKGSGKSAALVCTSGTAVANYFPAIIEAYYSQLPLIIISADRPYEMTNLDVNQTIDQKNIFGKYSSPTLALPLPTTQIAPSVLLEQIYNTINNQKGPVHINAPFAQPLHNQEQDIDENYLTKWQSVRPQPINPTIESDISIKIDQLEKTLLVIGLLPFALVKDKIIELIAHFPGDVYIDVTSSIKFQCARTRISKLSGKYQQVLHFGGRLTDKNYFAFLESSNTDKIIVVNQLSNKRDHFPKGFKKISASPNLIANKLLGQIDHSSFKNEQPNNDYSSLLSYPTLALSLVENAAENSNLYLANSMAIRVFDNIAISSPKDLYVACNRAASGIEGFIASASGMALATKRPTTLVIGDISFLHDCNSLSLIKKLPLTIIIVNNQGGKIFEQLPVSNDHELLSIITTPHCYTFSALAKQFDLSYSLADNISSFEEAYKSDKYRIIEVRL